MPYDPDKLEIVISARGANKWKWMVCERGGGPIEQGEISGARHKAVEAAREALDRLKSGR